MFDRCLMLDPVLDVDRAGVLCPACVVVIGNPGRVPSLEVRFLVCDGILCRTSIVPYQRLGPQLSGRASNVSRVLIVALCRAQHGRGAGINGVVWSGRCSLFEPGVWHENWGRLTPRARVGYEYIGAGGVRARVYA